MSTEDIVSILTIIVTIASIISAATPTPVDDGIVKKIYTIIELLALNVGRAKETGND